MTQNYGKVLGKAFIEKMDAIMPRSKRTRHAHDWLIVDYDRIYRDEDHNEFVIDTYKCECGAGSMVKTPKAFYDKGLKSMEFIEDKSL